MLQTVEAEIEVNGEVKFLEPLTITKKSRAIITLLGDEMIRPREIVENNAQDTEERFARHFGAIKSGNPRSADNEKIDGDLLRVYENLSGNE